MNPCCKGDRNQHPVTSSGLPCSFHQLQVSQTEQNSSGEKPVRVKRRRTRRERDYVRFGGNGTDCVLKQRPCCRGLQKALPPFWDAHFTDCAKPASFKRVGGTKPVIITQNRLSQHSGMFNKEVKSVNIERLLNLRCEQEVVEVAPLRGGCGADRQVGEGNQTGKSGGCDQKSIPCKQQGSSVNNPSGTNEDSLPIIVTPISAENHSRAPVNAMDPGSQSLAAAEVDQQSELQTAEADLCQSDVPAVTNEKENVPPVSAAGAESRKGKSLARELACELEKRLNLKAIFPGRNLINSTRQTIIRVLQEQKRKLPDFSALAQYKKVAGGCKGDAVQADFKTPARAQELQLELKPSADSRNSGRRASLKKRRGRDVFFLTSPSPAHTAVIMDEGRPSRREDFFTEPDGFDQQQNFRLGAVQHLPLLSSRHLNSIAESSLGSEGQCPLQQPMPRTAWPWEQGRRGPVQEPQSRQRRTKVAYGPLPKKSVPQRHCSPSSPWDSWNLSYLSTDNGRSRQFPVVDTQQYPYMSELRSEQGSFQEAQPAPVHSLNLSQEHSQILGGLRSTDRAASESQTSFDVLKSIWSPNVPSNRSRCPMPRALDYPFLTHQSSSLRELGSDKEEFLQLYSVNPEQKRSFSSCTASTSSPRHNIQQERRVPSRHPQREHWMLSGLAKARTCQKVALEPGKTSNSYQLWRPAEASLRTQATREKGCPSSRIQTCSWERLSQMEGLQQLRLFQQLPMSYFPPSEVLENKYSPLHTLQSHLMKQSSPEPWVFPRMKLY
uniref:Uncharacterized protein n=1 Tax=Sphaerodactylus townsendi TaxID=933632 RepID=A0ACB8FSL3_9SAUR